MLLLTSISDIVRVITGSAADIEVYAAWMDNASGTITPGRTNTASITTATTTTVVGSPAASTQRNVKHLSIFNNHASASSVVTVEHTDGTNPVVLNKFTLLAGESCDMTSTGQWMYYDASGAVKLASAKYEACFRVTANSVHATAATFADVTGLSCPVKVGRSYTIECHLYHISNATTTGAQFGFGGVAMTAMIAGAISTVTNSPTAATMSSGVVTAINTAVVVQTTGAATNAPTILSGTITPSADGTFAIRATSEVTVAAGLTVLAGSFLKVRETDN